MPGIPLNVKRSGHQAGTLASTWRMNQSSLLPLNQQEPQRTASPRASPISATFKQRRRFVQGGFRILNTKATTKTGAKTRGRKAKEEKQQNGIDKRDVRRARCKRCGNDFASFPAQAAARHWNSSCESYLDNAYIPMLKSWYYYATASHANSVDVDSAYDNVTPKDATDLFEDVYEDMSETDTLITATASRTVSRGQRGSINTAGSDTQAPKITASREGADTYSVGSSKSRTMASERPRPRKLVGASSTARAEAGASENSVDERGLRSISTTFSDLCYPSLAVDTGFRQPS